MPGKMYEFTIEIHGRINDAAGGEFNLILQDIAEIRRQIKEVFQKVEGHISISGIDFRVNEPITGSPVT